MLNHDNDCVFILIEFMLVLFSKYLYLLNSQSMIKTMSKRLNRLNDKYKLTIFSIQKKVFVDIINSFNYCILRHNALAATIEILHESNEN